MADISTLEEVSEEEEFRRVTDKLSGDMLEQRVVDKDGKTVEFYQLKVGSTSLLNIDPEVPLKYAKILKKHKAALKKIKTQEARITVLEDAEAESV